MELALNPEYKSGVKDALIHDLFKSLYIKIAEDIHAIIKLNVIHTNNPINRIAYKGEYYGEWRNKWDIPLLDESLHDQMDAVLKRKEGTDESYRNIDAYILRCLNHSNTIYDMYTLIPEQLHHHLQECTCPKGGVSTLSLKFVTEFNEREARSLLYVKKHLLKEILLK